MTLEGVGGVLVGVRANSISVLTLGCELRG